MPMNLQSETVVDIVFVAFAPSIGATVGYRAAAFLGILKFV